MLQWYLLLRSNDTVQQVIIVLLELPFLFPVLLVHIPLQLVKMKSLIVNQFPPDFIQSQVRVHSLECVNRVIIVLFAPLDRN